MENDCPALARSAKSSTIHRIEISSQDPFSFCFRFFCTGTWTVCWPAACWKSIEPVDVLETVPALRTTANVFTPVTQT